ncbi:MAG: Maf family protein [Bacteroidota bacterium]
MNLPAPVILASNSPRRKELLSELEVEFEILVRPVSEYFPEDIHPRAVAVLVSENKAKAYDDLSPDNIVITADTIVALEGEIMGKPENREHAVEMLTKLSGKTHHVVTGVTVFWKGRFKSFAEETLVTFKPLTREEIDYYIDTCEPYDKAGAYGIQEWIGKIGITGIEGDYYGVIGLPLCKLYQELTQLSA